MKIAWLTDIHLNFLEENAVASFVESVAAAAADALIITGDIAESPAAATASVPYQIKRYRPSSLQYLSSLAEACNKPLYFVLGNHDFYGGSIADTRRLASAYCSERTKLTYLTTSEIIPLSDTACLIGHDGWADGTLGRYWDSPIVMSDWLEIEDFRMQCGSRDIMDDDLMLERVELMKGLAQESAEHLARLLPVATSRFRHVVVATHVPPFEEMVRQACPGPAEDLLPHYANHVLGEVLRTHMAGHPEVLMTLLCGHTHFKYEQRVLPNLRALSGAAEYGAPVIQGVLDLE